MSKLPTTANATTTATVTVTATVNALIARIADGDEGVWGQHPHGLFVTHRRSGGIGGERRWTIYHKRLRIVTIAPGAAPIWADRSEAIAERAASRAANRALAAAMAEAVGEIDSLIAAGVPVHYVDGQKGGYFVLPSGLRASAEGAYRRYGGSSDDEGQWKFAVSASRGELGTPRGAHLPARRRECAVAEHFAKNPDTRRRAPLPPLDRW